MRYLFMYLLLISCNNKQESKKNSIDIQQKQKELLSITCSLVTLEGKKDIYTIKKDSIYFFNEKKILSNKNIEMIYNYPKDIYNKSRKYGCGVCVDGIDFEFIFKFKDNETIYEVQPRSNIPNKEKAFLNFLIHEYDKIVKINK